MRHIRHCVTRWLCVHLFFQTSFDGVQDTIRGLLWVIDSMNLCALTSEKLAIDYEADLSEDVQEWLLFHTKECVKHKYGNEKAKAKRLLDKAEAKGECSHNDISNHGCHSPMLKGVFMMSSSTACSFHSVHHTLLKSACRGTYSCTLPCTHTYTINICF